MHGLNRDVDETANTKSQAETPQFSSDTPRVVVITSGKGEIGKTTTTANVGLSLARLCFSVVAIDVDVGLRNLDLLLGLENCINYTAVEVLNGDCRLDQALVQDKQWSRRLGPQQWRYCLLCNMGMRNRLQASALTLSTS
ncbi:hypothetical protein Syun_017449 [Stephania yunnanensis]|uniref:CobQ/CobB/MinD/ParA nucleotide binding domain-containing protein n=1 Tax=Stephania yunnanensis TaxID=152371 RepID=A0AAP0J6K2_9MAGN